MRNNEEPVTNDSKTCTDLPLLPGGNNGNTGRASDGETSPSIAQLLENVFEPLPEPDFDLLDARDVRRWIERATKHLLSRREGQRLVRQAMRVLDHDWETAFTSKRLREKAVRQRERLLERERPDYWRERDHRRLASRPVHVVVDPAAWRRAKAAAVDRRTSVGVVVGDLVRREVRRRRQRDAVAEPGPDTVRLFTRIAVDLDTWSGARILASRSGSSVQRYVGILIEEGFTDEAR